MSAFPYITFDLQNNSYFVETGVSIVDLNSAISDATNNALFQFDEGNFILDEVLYVKRGDITLEGAENGNTTFLIDK